MGLNAKIFGKIVFWWLITVPVALGVSYGIEKLILLN
jgi:phosphate/sulfate permease